MWKNPQKSTCGKYVCPNCDIFYWQPRKRKWCRYHPTLLWCGVLVKIFFYRNVRIMLDNKNTNSRNWVPEKQKQIYGWHQSRKCLPIRYFGYIVNLRLSILIFTQHDSMLLLQRRIFAKRQNRQFSSFFFWKQCLCF